MWRAPHAERVRSAAERRGWVRRLVQRFKALRAKFRRYCANQARESHEEVLNRLPSTLAAQREELRESRRFKRFDQRFVRISAHDPAKIAEWVGLGTPAFAF